MRRFIKLNSEMLEIATYITGKESEHTAPDGYIEISDLELNDIAKKIKNKPIGAIVNGVWKPKKK